MDTDGVDLKSSASPDALILLTVDGQRMEARFGDLLESMPDGIVMASPSGHIVIANSQAERLFGYETGELRGMAVEQLLPLRYRSGHAGHRSNYMQQPRKRASTMSYMATSRTMPPLPT